MNKIANYLKVANIEFQLCCFKKILWLLCRRVINNKLINKCILHKMFAFMVKRKIDWEYFTILNSLSVNTIRETYKTAAYLKQCKLNF